MKRILSLLLIFITAPAMAQTYEDRALPDIKMAMLTELYQLTESDKTIESLVSHALSPPLQDVEGWGDKEIDCILQQANDTLQQPIFNALLKRLPSELIAENIMFFQSDFGQKVNRVVIHGSGLSGLTESEQEQVINNRAVLSFLRQQMEISDETVLVNMEQALGPAILSCTPEP